MANNTYVALKTSTVSVATPTVTISSIPSGYTDLVLVMSGSTSGSINNTIRVGNGSVDTGSNYSCTILSGSGSSAVSTRRSNDTSFQPNYNGYTNTGQSQMIVQFQNYSNTSVFKTMISRSDNAATGTDAVVGLWRSTSAIDTIQLLANGGFNWQVGTTFTLYGISNAGQSSPKATGGNVYSDATYWYHAFPMSGSFIPNQSLTADILVVAGGGGGGQSAGASGGGGAGGLQVFTSQALTATNYQVLIGAGGTRSVTDGGIGGNGGNSQFGALTASVGGGGGGGYGIANTGGSGGGGGYFNGTNNGAGYPGAAGTSGQGNAGGQGWASSGNHAAGGGGGAGAAGSNATTGVPGPGGAGVNTYSSWLSATGLGVSGFIAGGGGGGAYNAIAAGGSGGGGAGSRGVATPYVFAGNGVVSTGGGGGGGANGEGQGSSGAGGSGVVIVRYAK